MIRTVFPNRTQLLIFIASLASLIMLATVTTSCGRENKPAKGPDSTAKGTTAKTPGGDTSALTPEFQEGEPADVQAAYTIHLAPHAGDLYSYRLSMSGVTEFEGKQATDNETYCFTQKVTGVNNDGSFTIEMRYDSITSRKMIPAGIVDSSSHTIAFDTRKKVDSTVPDAAHAKALIGQRVNLTISKAGDVREISNIEPVLSAILGKLRDSVPPQMIEQLRNQIKITLFQAVIQQMFLQNVPDTAVHEGSSWSRRDTIPLSLPIATVPSRAAVTYRLAEVKKVNDAMMGRIAMSLSTEFPQKKMSDQLADATIDAASASGSGEMLLDMTSGFPVRKTTKIDVSLKITATAKQGPAKGKSKTLSQRKSSTTLVELLDYKPAAK